MIDYRQQVDSRTLEDVDGNPLVGSAAFDALVAQVCKNSERPQVARMFATLCAEALHPDHRHTPGSKITTRAGERNIVAAVEAGTALDLAGEFDAYVDHLKLAWPIQNQ